MYRFKNSLIAFAGLLSLIGVIALITPRTGLSQKVKAPQDVRLVGTIVTQPVSASSPLPVTGSVGISGTPTVNVANTPTVGIDPSSNTVKLDTASPVPVRDVDNPARQPFTFEGGGYWDGFNN